MKTNKTMSKLVAGAAFALAAIAPSYGQNNLGQSCGCPPVNARTTVTVSSLAGYSVVTAITGNGGGELTQGGNWTCNNTYILDKKIFVPSGQVLNIQPGTVIKGNTSVLADDATALIIERGGKIIANGTKECPIVFTSALDVNVDGTYGVINRGKWGGLVILGKATNNLNLAQNGPVNFSGKLACADGVGVVEGFNNNISQYRFGVCPNTNVGTSGELTNQIQDDEDNSGILKYVSVRHSGAILTIGAEINGITLGSVGRGTTIDNIEIVSCADDGIEFFGGTVNVKHVTMLFGNDDMFDWDDGWKGKGQFLFGMKGDTQANWSEDSDNGFECDADDQRTNALPKSHPVIYNATIIGNAKSANTSDNSGLAAIQAKEGTEGEIYNSIFANFRSGLNLVKTSPRTAGTEAWNNWALGANGGNGSLSLKIKCNTFIAMTNSLSLDAINSGTVYTAPTAPTVADQAQFSADGNVSVASLAGFNYAFTANPSTNAFTVKNDVIPNPAISNSGCPAYPVDGFFTTVSYRGAFASTGDNWLSDWSYSAVLGTTGNLAACPTDINKDGQTNISDFLLLLPQFNTSCN